jgi:phage protein U
MTVMRYFGIRFMLRILFFQKIQRQAIQEYRRKKRSNKIENCDSLGSWNPWRNYKDSSLADR